MLRWTSAHADVLVRSRRRPGALAPTSWCARADVLVRSRRRSGALAPTFWCARADVLVRSRRRSGALAPIERPRPGAPARTPSLCFYISSRSYLIGEMQTYNVFAGVFADEPGQRFLRILNELCDNTFQDLYSHSMPHHPKRFVECLDRVASWDKSVVNDELRQIQLTYPDLQSVFKTVFVNYARTMRSAKSTKLSISLPRLGDFVQAVFVKFSGATVVRNANYFKTQSVLERRVMCMDILRDCLFDHIGTQYVRLEKRVTAAASVANEESVVASSVICEDSDAGDNAVDTDELKSGDAEMRVRAMRGLEKDDVASKVVSNVFENELPAGSSASRGADDVASSIGPDDSVSSVDFAQKQRAELMKLKHSGPKMESLREADDHSQTSLSLSSVSISQDGKIQRKNNAAPCRVSAGARHARPPPEFAAPPPAPAMPAPATPAPATPAPATPAPATPAPATPAPATPAPATPATPARLHIPMMSSPLNYAPRTPVREDQRSIISSTCSSISQLSSSAVSRHDRRSRAQSYITTMSDSD
jgi:hypothetical protein